MHKHVMFTMGEDFHYSNANKWFTNLDKLIMAANKRANTYTNILLSTLKTIGEICFQSNQTGIRLFYSTPSCYAKAIQNSSAEFPRKEDDYFPYATSTHSYWTGYFTSKPNFKGIVRKSSAFLQANIENIKNVVYKFWKKIYLVGPPFWGLFDNAEFVEFHGNGLGKIWACPGS